MSTDDETLKRDKFLLDLVWNVSFGGNYSKLISGYIFDKYSVTVDKDIVLCRRERERHLTPDENGNYDDSGFTSTSIYEFAKEDEYGDELSYILIPEGTSILYLEGITTSSEDYEVLFPPNIHLNYIEDLSIDKKVWMYS